MKELSPYIEEYIELINCYLLEEYKEEYIELINCYILEKKNEIKIEKEKGWNVVKNENKKVKWKFVESKGIEKGIILVYEKVYKNLITVEYEYRYKYEKDIWDIESLMLCYYIIVFELEEDNEEKDN